MKITAAALLGIIVSLAANDASAQYPIHQNPIHRNYPLVITKPPIQIVKTNYVYGARNHLDTLADQLQTQAKAITWDMYQNYQGNHDFNATYGEMYELFESANHLHQLIHDASYFSRHHDVDHIAKDLHQMDQLFHHIEDNIAHWTPTRIAHHHGQVHSNLHRKIEAMEDTLHHLMEDYGVRSNIGAPPVPGFAPPRP